MWPRRPLLQNKNTNGEIMKKKQIVRTRHYYTDRNHFEQSYDIYSSSVDPNNAVATANDEDESKDSSSSVVILVVGSGWMGHCWWIYSMTSWWNSGGPINIAHIPHTKCVCVRHRGAYFQCPQLSTILTIMVMGCLIFGGIAIWVDNVDMTLFLWTAISLLVLLLSLYVHLQYNSQRAASLEDMLHDVAQAMAFYFDNHHSSQSNKDSSIVEVADDDEDCQQQQEARRKQHTPPKVYFGGYSSGAHVALTLLHRPDVWNTYFDSKPSQLLHGIWIISGVLAVRPEIITMPSSSSSSKSTTATTTNTILLSHGHDQPQWLTNWVMQTVWGSTDQQAEIPSPIAQPKQQYPKIPHLFVGNVYELLFEKCSSWLNVFLSPMQEYVEVLQAHKIPAKFRTVDSDHWNILASPELRRILQEELATAASGSSSIVPTKSLLLTSSS